MAEYGQAHKGAETQDHCRTRDLYSLLCSGHTPQNVMGEMGNRAEFKDETMLQFTLFVPTRKRQAGKLERVTFFVPNLGTAFIIGKNFNMYCWVDVN